MQYQ